MERITSKSDGGLKISSDVIRKIAEIAATEITGVAADGQKLDVTEMVKTVAGHFFNPISVRLTKEAVEIDICITVIQGHKAVNVAEAVQNSIKSAVQNMTGIPVSKVNVKIIGIQIVNEVE